MNFCRNIMRELIKYEDTSQGWEPSINCIGGPARPRLSLTDPASHNSLKNHSEKIPCNGFCNQHFLGNDIWTLVSTRRLIKPWPCDLEHIKGVVKNPIPLSILMVVLTPPESAHHGVVLLITLFWISLPSAFQSPTSSCVTLL